MWTCNSNKVIWRLPNLTCKFISCACNFIPHLHSYKTAYSVRMFSPSWSLSLCATLTWLHGFPHWGVWDVKDFPPVGTVSSSAHCVFSLHRHCADSNRKGTDTVSYYVDFIFLCLFFSVPCLGSKEEMELRGGCFLWLDILQSRTMGCLGPPVPVH